MVFPVVMYGCESWTINKVVCQRSDAFELWCLRRLESPLDCKEIPPVYPRGNQSWIFNGRSDAEAEVPILWPPDAKNWLTRKDPYSGKDWRQEEKGMPNNEMVGWRYWLDGPVSWWWARKPGILQSMGSQRVGYDWLIELNWNNYHAKENIDYLHYLGFFLSVSPNLVHPVAATL